MSSSSALSSVARIAQLPTQKKSTSFKSRRSSIVRAAKREEVRARADVLFGFVVLIFGKKCVRAFLCRDLRGADVDFCGRVGSHGRAKGNDYARRR